MSARPARKMQGPDGSTVSPASMKARLKRDAAQYPEPTRVRLHRALSWLERASREANDPDAMFVFLWIAFNAAYAREFGHDENERARFAQFIGALLAVDEAKRLQSLIFSQFSGSVRTLIDNKFVFEPFWKALREHDSSNRWEKSFHDGQKAALGSLMANDTARVLSIVFDRLYVLRNQLIHGGATWNSKVNRAQVKDGAKLLTAVIPLILELMLDHPELELGDVLYPVIA